ncbi:golgin subfamily A member 1 isoform X2 [Sceloporus undulatus]|uniref:golgin subfamily A member 1 isoform X2 n=1 Tax=Sceloporus undulatus TaxID=8520 RepID=UPI001C4C0DE7|nr:golgin subfamily A member 1 isoform X2 [Sceloporus undulatus]
MFAKLKKKIAEEAATAPRGVSRMPRSVSKESITSMGADSGDDFPSDGSSSREDLSSQLFRRNEQIRKLEVKLSDYAEQVRNLQKIKEKLENALETHQDSFVKKLQEQNEAHQASTAKMAEGMALALEKKDQEWKEKLSHLEKLLKKEELLAQMEEELGSATQEVACVQEELQVSRALSTRLAAELQELQQQHADLQAERAELEDAERSAESKITMLEQRGHELQAYVQRLSVDLQNAQVAASCCEKRLETLQGEHDSLKLEYEQHKQKMIIEVEEKSQLVGHLQEKVTMLEKRFEGNLSGDEHIRDLLKEKCALEQRLEEARQQLLATRTSHTENMSLLETQINKLNGKLAEGQACLSEREELVRSLQESTLQQQKDLEQALRLASEAAAKSKEDIEERELQIQKLQADLELERIKSEEGLSAAQHHYAVQMGKLEEQAAALEAAQESERVASQCKISQLEKENEELKIRCKDMENSLTLQESELERLKAELRSHAEIAQTQEETQKQREELLQRQVADLTSLLKEKDLLIVEKTDTLLKEEEELKHLRQGHDALVQQIQQLQSSLKLCQQQAAEQEAEAEMQRNALQAQLREQQERLAASEKQAATLVSAALKKHLHPSEDGEAATNGEVSATDVVQLQKENRDLEQQIAEKNKMIKQLQQRMTELKKTLQKELKIRPDGEVPEAPTAALTVTNNADLNDSREINFEYLKHVVLKFMSCRESEAFHLIKAVSMLLNFSQEEENMLKETLEYKMSWFGSKPPPRGSIRPSISSPRTPWL